MPSLAKLIILEGPMPGEEILLQQSELVIGRDVSAGLVLSSPAVSRRHARIFQAGDAFWIEDLGSSNKTYLNEQILESPQPLNSGDAIRFGGAILLSFVLLPDAIATLAEALPPGLAGTMLETSLPPDLQDRPAHLMVTLPGHPPAVYPFDKASVRLGRATDNDIILPSPIVSGYHAVIERSAQGYRLRLAPNTTNPLYYQGEPVIGEQDLHDGDLRRLGSQEAGMQVNIGRTSVNQVVIDQNKDSKKHAEVIRKGNLFILRDLDNTKGTWFKGEKVGELILQDDDSLQRDVSGNLRDITFQTENAGDSTVLEKSAVLEQSDIHPFQQYHGSLLVDNDVKMRLKVELTR